MGRGKAAEAGARPAARRRTDAVRKTPKKQKQQKQRKQPRARRVERVAPLPRAAARKRERRREQAVEALAARLEHTLLLEKARPVPQGRLLTASCLGLAFLLPLAVSVSTAVWLHAGLRPLRPARKAPAPPMEAVPPVSPVDASDEAAVLIVP